MRAAGGWGCGCGRAGGAVSAGMRGGSGQAAQRARTLLSCGCVALHLLEHAFRQRPTILAACRGSAGGGSGGTGGRGGAALCCYCQPVPSPGGISTTCSRPCPAPWLAGWPGTAPAAKRRSGLCACLPYSGLHCCRNSTASDQGQCASLWPNNYAVQRAAHSTHPVLWALIAHSPAALSKFVAPSDMALQLAALSQRLGLRVAASRAWAPAAAWPSVRSYSTVEAMQSEVRGPARGVPGGEQGRCRHRRRCRRRRCRRRHHSSLPCPSFPQIDSINDAFVEARDEIEYAKEEAGEGRQPAAGAQQARESVFTRRKRCCCTPGNTPPAHCPPPLPPRSLQRRCISTRAATQRGKQWRACWTSMRRSCSG